MIMISLVAFIIVFVTGMIIVLPLRLLRPLTEGGINLVLVGNLAIEFRTHGAIRRDDDFNDSIETRKPSFYCRSSACMHRSDSRDKVSIAVVESRTRSLRHFTNIRE
ncbi:hypothetical protein K2D_19340 [Planctomycetes bacterium K2D]|nr:hypothetical protein K2D_19340 [Planctomycetes bacterium K2D]